MEFKKLIRGEYLATTAIIIALASLAVSVKSCQQTERAVTLAQLEFDEARSFFWLGTVNSELALELNPSNPDIKIQAADATVPRLFAPFPDHPSLELGPVKYLISLASADAKLRDLWTKDTVFDPEDGSFRVTQSVPNAIPIAIESRYVVRGQIRADRSLYYLSYSVTALANPRATAPIHYKIETVEYAQLRFIRRLSETDDATAVVQEIWESSPYAQKSKPATK